MPEGHEGRNGNGNGVIREATDRLRRWVIAAVVVLFGTAGGGFFAYWQDRDASAQFEKATRDLEDTAQKEVQDLRRELYGAIGDLRRDADKERGELDALLRREIQRNTNLLDTFGEERRNLLTRAERTELWQAWTEDRQRLESRIDRLEGFVYRGTGRPLR